jgi:hypothetical protein
MADQKKTILIDIQVDTAETQKQLIAVEKALQDNAKARKDLNDKIKDGIDVTEEDIIEKKKLEAISKKLASEQRVLIQQSLAEANSVTALRAKIAQLNQERNKLNTGTKEGTERFNELTAELADLNQTLNESSKSAGQFKDNIGNYAEGVKEGIESAGASFKSAFSKETFGAISEGFSAVWRTILANPIVAITALVAGFVTLVVSAFASTEKGGNKIAEIFARFKPILDGIYSIFAGIGEAVFFIIDGASQLFSAFADLFGASTERSAQLTKQLQEVNKELVKQESRSKEIIGQEERLKTIRDDESQSLQKRIFVNEKIGKLEQERLNGLLKGEQKKLQIMEAQLALVPENIRTAEQINAIEEQRGKIGDINADIQGKITEQITNQVSLLKEAKELENDIKNTALELEIAQGKISEDSAEALQRRIQLQKDARDNALSGIKDFQGFQKVLGSVLNNDQLARLVSGTSSAVKKVVQDTDLEIQKLQNAFNEKQVENFKDVQSKLAEASEARKAKEAENLAKEKELRAKDIADRIAGFQLAVAEAEKGSELEAEARINLLRAQSEAEIEQSELTGNALALKQAETNQKILDVVNQFNAERLAQNQIANETEIANNQLIETENLRRIQNEIDAKNLALAQKEANAVLEIEGEYEKNQRLLEIQAENFEATKELEIEQANAKLEYELEFIAKSDEEKQALMIANAEALLGIEKKYLNGKKEIAEQLRISDEQLAKNTADVFGSIAGFFEEQTVAYKLFASIQATINSYLGASQVLADKTLPTFLKPILAGVILAQGLFQVAKINQVEGFAEGGIVTGGIPIQRSNGDNVLATLKIGEAVLTPTQQRSVGYDNLAKAGVPGIPPVGATDLSEIDASNNLSNTMNLVLSNLPNPVVSVIDIQDVSKRVEVKQTTSNL